MNAWTTVGRIGAQFTHDVWMGAYAIHVQFDLMRFPGH